jgi:prepilin-type N-terminal cleavage/methylation domain-containing protein
MKRRGFTLLELLVSMAIIAVLAAIAWMAIGGVRRSAASAREVSAARQAIAGYLRAAADRDGELMVGYAANEMAADDRGHAVPNPACGRYPWRLAPYLEYRLKGTLLVNEQEAIASIQDHEDFVYRASAYPSFGINATYVGGNERTGLMPSPATLRRFGNFVTTRLTQVSTPGKLLVFASARSKEPIRSGQREEGDDQAGFHLLTPPRTSKVEWHGPYDEDAPAHTFGFLHLRHKGRAVCAFLGGNVELLDGAQLQDMRYWSAQAAENDDPDFRLKPTR